MNGMTHAVRIACAGLLAALTMVFAATAQAASSEYIPFVTDFPQPAAPAPAVPVAAPPAGAEGIDWAALVAGGVGGATLAALLVGSAFLFARRVRPA
jgi:hypothetical protein